VHAAGIYEQGKQQCCSDYVVSSYTPTLAALVRAQESWPVLNMDTSSLALVAATHAQDSALPVLQSVREEMNRVISITKKTRISVNEDYLQHSATLTYADGMLTSCSLAHIACHGIQHPTNALLSGFCLQDGNLTISRLIELDLKSAFFAFLSACETAKGDARQPDQTVHLAATMLFVGFRSVVATMW
jgi:CHAT domain-containing protein